MINKYAARILEVVINIGGPATAGILLKTVNISETSLYNNLDRMVRRGELEKKKFLEEGINRLDYKISDADTGGGKPPVFFYIVTRTGLKKYEYYKEQGVYDEEDTTREDWQRKRGIIP